MKNVLVFYLIFQFLKLGILDLNANPVLPIDSDLSRMEFYPGFYKSENQESKESFFNNFVYGMALKGSISGNVSADGDYDDVGDVNIPAVVLNLYIDLNGDGVLSPSELLAGTALIDSDNDGLFDDAGTTTTDASGNYTFSGVIPGNYIVVETQPSGYNSIIENDATPADPGSDMANTDAHDDRIPVTVADNEADNDNNFIEVQIGSVSGNVKSDNNNDDTGDTNIAAVALNLYRDLDGNGVLSPTEKAAGPAFIDSDLDGLFDDQATTTSDASGNYTFYGVRPGVYLIEETQPANYSTVSEIDISPDAGGDQVDANNKNNIIPVTVASGEADGGNNFVEELNGRISGSVFKDTEKDDVVDKSEPVSGITISLLDGAGNPVLDENGSPVTTITKVSGFYEFVNRPPGNYIIEIGSIPSSDVLIYDNDDASDGANDGETNDGDQFNGRIPVTIAPGMNEIDGTNDFIISAITLPVKLVIFEAISFNEYVKINWETSSEGNNKGYEILHSIDAKNFNKIGFVSDKTSSNEKLSYSFIHNNPSYWQNYYQLSQIDLNGKVTKSKIISTLFENKERELRLFPNPTDDYITVKGLSPEDVVMVSDNNGKVLVSSTHKRVEETISLGKFPSGIYNVTIYRNGSVYTSKRIVKRQ